MGTDDHRSTSGILTTFPECQENAYERELWCRLLFETMVSNRWYYDNLQGVSALNAREFIAELYVRSDARHGIKEYNTDFGLKLKQRFVRQVIHHYPQVMPPSRDAAILDIGLGDGWFVAACLAMGYRSIWGADFAVSSRNYVKEWAHDDAKVSLDNIDTTIIDYLSK